MIVPVLRLNPQVRLDDPKWCWFGRLHVAAGAGQHGLLKPLVMKLGGAVDIQIEAPGLSPDDALQLLNDGAAKIVVTQAEFDEFSAVIPSERLRVVVGELSELRGDENNVLLRSESTKGLDKPSGSLQVETSEPVAACPQGVDVLTADLSADNLTAFFVSKLRSDRPDGLWTTVIVDELGIALGLAYSNEQSLHAAFDQGLGVYWSRSRDELWIKGKTSGAVQGLLGVTFDCDSDCLRFTVLQQQPGFCHKKTYTCFGEQRNIQSVLARLQERITGADEKSFTRKLANDPDMLRKKLLEEAQELSDATDPDEVAWEAADVIYFALIRMLERGVSLNDVYKELARRMNRVVRRPNKLEQ